MHFFHGYVYPVCMLICLLWMMAVWIGWLHMIFSFFGVLEIVWYTIKLIFTFKLREFTKNVSGVLTGYNGLPGGVFGLIPGIAFIILVVFLPSNLEYRYRYGRSIDGTYGKIVEVVKFHQVEGRDPKRIYDVVIDLGYGAKRSATLIREPCFGYDEPKIGEVLLVATNDGKEYRDHFRDLIIRPSFASWQ